MAKQVVATKGNLIAYRKTLSLAKNGFDMMDRKRNILIREMMTLMDKVKQLRSEISSAYSTGYFLLQQANLTSGVIGSITKEIPEEEGITLTSRSVMGVEVPTVLYEAPEKITVPYGLEGSNSQVDAAYVQFQKVKQLTMILAEVDNSVYRLAKAIQKTQKRANALKNIVIPGYEKDIEFIRSSLEEKQREEFSRMKVMKARKQAN